MRKKSMDKSYHIQSVKRIRPNVYSVYLKTGCAVITLTATVGKDKILVTKPDGVYIHDVYYDVVMRVCDAVKLVHDATVGE